MQTLSKPISLLIADDHPSIRHGIKRMLEKEKCIKSIDEADCGKKVLSLLENTTYDIILMDIGMPTGDGYETTQTITKQYPEVLVIALSMHIEERYVIRMFQAGAKGYLIKNAEREDILLAIEEVLAGRKYISRELSQSLLDDKNILSGFSKQKSKHTEDLREIIFLICAGKTSKEIADIKYFATRTVEKYRQEINELTKSKNTAGVMAYAVQKGIPDDLLLKNKFSKHLQKHS